MDNRWIHRIRKLAKANDAFRRELTTTDRLQVVLMCLQEGEDIGEETHEDTDQALVVVPAGTVHNLVNDAGESLRLYTIYVPPHHPRGTVHLTRADAMAAEDAAHPAAEITQ